MAVLLELGDHLDMARGGVAQDLGVVSAPVAEPCPVLGRQGSQVVADERARGRIDLRRDVVADPRHLLLDDEINALLEEQAVSTMARQAPVATDLRLLVAGLRMSAKTFGFNPVLRAGLGMLDAVLELLPARRRSAEQLLERLYRASQRVGDLANLYERRVSTATTADERAAAEVLSAEIALDRGEQPEGRARHGRQSAVSPPLQQACTPVASS